LLVFLASYNTVYTALEGLCIFWTYLLLILSPSTRSVISSNCTILYILSEKTENFVENNKHELQLAINYQGFGLDLFKLHH